MHITAIESLRLEAYQRLLLVRVHTDTGLIGVGETVDKIPGTLGALHGTIAPLLLGQDPLDIEGNWHFVFDNLMYHGYSGAELRALSAIEIALWDVLGQHYGAPLFHLLGGRTREWVMAPLHHCCWAKILSISREIGALCSITSCIMDIVVLNCGPFRLSR